MKLQDFVSFLHNNNLIDLDNLLKKDEVGCINRLKLQKYVYLAQTCFDNNFGYEYNIYTNGPYSPELANYYYENLDPDKIYSNVKDSKWNDNKSFTDRFITLFKNKEPEWLEVACTLLDITNYCENEQECLNRAYAIKSEYDKSYMDNIWKELKEKNLVHHKSRLKLNNFLSMF